MAGIHPYLDRPGPLALAHRGFSLDGLENSMAAFAAAVELGYDYVETDVHATSDGVVVALHDATLDRVTDRTGAVAGLPWSEVSKALIGGVEPVPALEDVLGSWPRLRVNIDVKSAGAAAPLARVLDRTRAHDRVCIASFSDARRRAVLRRVAAPVATSAGQTLIAAFVAAASTPGLRRFAGSVLRGVDCLQVPATFRGRAVVTPASVAAAHAAGKPVHVWTVNEPAELRRLLDLGVDGLITDRADLLRDVLRSRGQWHPAG
ncbi:glycerophosphodiester phosphodiesterase family protein [Jiangella alkaliphila]|uniref:Glycerophosphoryl diester phosphodiesterase n=1 Tax=Jiangella alkaliphila TaxID=419479 RepID=A0A1H2KUE9_9ACTN|nr:glycerophosphodiester phosphodiesterase family protein [Jiangella alkaliphila]SDU72262.1 glycerophosphoryl diester phosphodiesterase [Jiangella alkaliphila]